MLTFHEMNGYSVQPKLAMATPRPLNDEDDKLSEKVAKLHTNVPVDTNAVQPLTEFEKYRITDSTAINEPVPVIKINDEIISTEGNITTISGASKSGKSAFTGFLIAGAISIDGELMDELEGLKVAPNITKKAVVHIDTEQAKHKHRHNLISVFRRTGCTTCPEHFLSYNIRELDIGQYKKITIGICEAAKKVFGGIHLIVIDGLADYINDVNDAIQSNAVVKFFEDLAIIYQTPIVVIVHTNPGGDKERGHLGSQCQRKSESVLTVKAGEGDISYLEPKLLRMAGKENIPLLQFRYDKEKGYHVSCGVRAGVQVDKDKGRVLHLGEIALKAFPPPTALRYNEAVQAIMTHSQKGERTAKDMLTEMKALNLVVQDEDKQYTLNKKEEIE